MKKTRKSTQPVSAAEYSFSRPYWLDQRSDVPEQFLAVGWAEGGGFGGVAEMDGPEPAEKRLLKGIKAKVNRTVKERW